MQRAFLILHSIVSKTVHKEELTVLKVWVRSVFFTVSTDLNTEDISLKMHLHSCVWQLLFGNVQACVLNMKSFKTFLKVACPFFLQCFVSWNYYFEYFQRNFEGAEFLIRMLLIRRNMKPWKVLLEWMNWKLQFMDSVEHSWQRTGMDIIKNGGLLLCLL